MVVLLVLLVLAAIVYCWLALVVFVVALDDGEPVRRAFWLALTWPLILRMPRVGGA